MLRAFGTLLYALGLELYKTEEKIIHAPTDIIALANARWEAKESKNFAQSDAIREELMEKGWVVNDKKDGFNLERRL